MIIKKFNVIILAGGKGSRIKNYLSSNPKPLVKIGKMSFLKQLIQNISKYNVNKIIILAGYRGKKIYDKFHGKKINLIDIECVIEEVPLGTGGCLALIKKKIDDKFIVINGDTFFDIDLNNFFNNFLKKNESLIALSNDTNYSQNNKLIGLTVNKENKISFQEKSKLFNGGIYLFNKNFLNKIKLTKCSLEEDLLKPEIIKKNVIGKLFVNFFIDIGTPKNFKRANKILVKYLTRPALFIDRDGTINIDKGYTHKVKDLLFIKKTIQVMKYIYNKKYFLFIVTNQAGIAKNLFDIEDFYKFQEQLKYKLYKKQILINDIKFCPFHKNGIIKEYTKISKYRKPDNLMIKSLLNNHNILVKKSLMIGNTKSDELCAKKSGLIFFNVNSKNFLKEIKKFIN